MELQVPSFPVFLTFFLLVFMFLKLVKTYKTNNLKPKLPPGPWKLPIIGNMLHLIGSLPHHCLRDLAKMYGPLMHLQLGNENHDIIFSNRPHLLAPDIMTYGSTGIAFAPYGDYGRHLRKICKVELLNSKCVQSFRSIREEEVSNLICFISSNAGLPINLSEKIFSSTFGITARAAFGKKCKDQEAFITLVKENLEVAGGFSVSDVFPSLKFLHVVNGMRPKLEELHKKMDKVLENIVNEHKVVKSMKKTGNRKVDDLVVVDDIFIAGSETSSSTVEWAMSEMLKHSSVMEKAQAEVRWVFELLFLKAVIKETLRLHPPLPLLIPRECTESCEINGYGIPAKTKVIVNAWAIGRDPSYWTEAESFYPERFLDSSVDYKGVSFEFIPFGAGRRICPGITFATPNVELPLAQLLYHFDWKLPTQTKHQDLDMTENFGATVRRKNDLYVIPIPYHPMPVN
ncbi:premnaspirodiene oxygenase-like isoform X1 [Fagus crenata]